MVRTRAFVSPGAAMYRTSKAVTDAVEARPGSPAQEGSPVWKRRPNGLSKASARRYNSHNRNSRQRQIGRAVGPKGPGPDLRPGRASSYVGDTCAPSRPSRQFAVPRPCRCATPPFLPVARLPAVCLEPSELFRRRSGAGTSNRGDAGWRPSQRLPILGRLTFWPQDVGPPLLKARIDQPVVADYSTTSGRSNGSPSSSSRRQHASTCFARHSWTPPDACVCRYRSCASAANRNRTDAPSLTATNSNNESSLSSFARCRLF